jgi:hypothetical protein
MSMDEHVTCRITSDGELEEESDPEPGAIQASSTNYFPDHSTQQKPKSKVLASSIKRHSTMRKRLFPTSEPNSYSYTYSNFCPRCPHDKSGQDSHDMYDLRVRR